MKFSGIQHDRNLDTYLKGILFMVIRKRVMREIIPGGQDCPPPHIRPGVKGFQDFFKGAFNIFQIFDIGITENQG